jgi:creatinine amidohydrolase/Fe(II)-dependent formamide hydrolase-like protein
LRFHPRNSPITEVPEPPRRRVLELLAQHAEGAIRRVGRTWQALDLAQAWEHDPEFSGLSSFESTVFRRPPAGSDAGLGEHPGDHPEERREGVLWSELSWPQAKKRLAAVDIALLPVGAIEQHGPHLPLDVDAFDADYLARHVALACSPPRPLVLPLIPYGVSYHHDDFPGTLSVTNETLARLVYEVGMAAARNGIEKLLILNGHGGNAATLHFAAQQINRDSGIFTSVDSGETSDADIYAMTETPNDVHAGEIETSTTLAIRPDLVDMSQAKDTVPSFSSSYLDFTSKRSIGWYAHTHKISENGVMGAPSRASREKGERIWHLMIDHLVELVEHLKALTLDEIHQRRY